MKKKWIIISSVVSIVLLVCVMMGPVMSNVEQPNYQTITTTQTSNYQEVSTTQNPDWSEVA